MPLSVDTDSSYYQAGAVLFRTYPGGERKPSALWSRSLNPHEKNYSTTEKEYLAVSWALPTLCPYLLGHYFTVHSDQAALRLLMNSNGPSGRLMCWRLELFEFDTEIQYKRDLINTGVDALSRLLTSGETVHEID